MTSGQVTQLLQAVAQLIGVLVWPVALVFILVYFRKSLENFITNLGEFSFKTPGIEASAKRRATEAAEAAAALGAAQAAARIDRPTDEAAPVAAVDPKVIAESVVPATRARRRMQRSQILWVDDNPDNNIYERQALEALGVEIVLSFSTDDALRKIRRDPYDLIISDMGRPQDPRAGYTLLDRLRQDGDQTPYIIYAGSRRPEHVAEALKHGATGATNDPQELFSKIIRILQV